MDLQQELDRVLEDAVARGVTPGVAVTVADRTGVRYEGAAGRRSAAGVDPMTPDTLVRLASMTKIVTTVAALQLVEAGSLALDAPVAEYRPEFADLPVLEGFRGDEPVLRPAKRQATVRQLMTHTAGLGYFPFNADLARWEQVTGTPNVMTGQAAAFTAPLCSDPGTRFEYGFNIEWLGRVVEAVAGRPLDAVVAESVTGPLGMAETTGAPSFAQRLNLAPVHVRGEDGSWVATDIDWAPEPEYVAGGSYLYSTARDYLAFQRMLLGGGALGDARIVAPGTVEAIFADQLGGAAMPAVMASVAPPFSHDVEFGAGATFGLGLLLQGADAPGRRTRGSGSWWGVLGTRFWVDRTAGVTVALHQQVLPFAAPEAEALLDDVERAVYAAG